MDVVAHDKEWVTSSKEIHSFLYPFYCKLIIKNG